MSTRRQFLQVGGAVAGGALLRWQSNPATGSLFQVARALAASGQTALAGNSIPQFVTPLPTFNARRVSTASFQVQMREFQQKVLPDQFYARLAPPFSAGTSVFGYQVGGQPASYPATTIVGQRGTPTIVKYVNAIPSRSTLSKSLRVDQSLHWADPLGTSGGTGHGASTAYGIYDGPQPGVPHLHGAEVPSAYDGVPDAWFTSDGRRGPAYSSLAPTDANAAIYRYPNSQPASTLWWHDHTLGMTRINVLSGLAGMYLLRDQYDTGLPNNPLGLPAGEQEVELVLQDRQFGTNGRTRYSWPGRPRHAVPRDPPTLQSRHDFRPRQRSRLARSSRPG